MSIKNFFCNWGIPDKPGFFNPACLDQLEQIANFFSGWCGGDPPVNVGPGKLNIMNTIFKR